MSVKLVLLLAIFILAAPNVSAYASGAVAQYSAAGDLLASGNATGATAAYGAAIALEPAYFEAWNGLADARNRNGQFDEALEASNRSLEINPGYVRGWINRGQILYNIGYRYEDTARDMAAANILYGEQLAAFEKAIALDNTSAEAWFNKGYALGGLKRYDEAIAAFDRVAAIDPLYPNLRKNREIAVQLRDLSAKTTTGPLAATQSPSTPVTTGDPLKTTSAKPAPLPVAAVLSGIVCAAFLALRK